MNSHSWVLEDLGNIVNIGLPIMLLTISVFSFIWFAVEVKKKRIDFRSMIGWVVLNSLYTLAVVYVLIIAILHFFYIGNAGNIFNMLAYYAFGLELPNGKQWILILILIFIAYILLKSFINSIKISRLEQRIDDLAKEVAILSGKINKTAYFTSGVAENEKTSKELKTELREKIRKAKAEQRALAKLKMIDDKNFKLKNNKDK